MPWIPASFMNWKKPVSWTPSGKSRRSYLTETVTVRDSPIHFSKKSGISVVDTDPRGTLTLHFPILIFQAKLITKMNESDGLQKLQEVLSATKKKLSRRLQG